MFFQHIFESSLAHASYLIGCQAKGVAIVIDPKRDVDTYLSIAEKNNLKITHIAETHIHADYLSGSLELASLTGAQLYLSDEGGPEWQYDFDHIGLKHQDEIKLGNLIFKVLHTPGHTPESISFLLTDTPATSEPVMLFTGDFVFVGDVGRPDLLENAAGLIGTKEIGAHQMFESLKIFANLPEFVQVWPAHGAGSACGKALGAVPSTTVGYEKVRNWALQFGNNEVGFVEELLSGQPEPPKYFAMMKKLNKIKRPLLTSVPNYKELETNEFVSHYQNNVTVIDTRHKIEFAKGFIPNSINIQNNKAFSNWAGWILDYNNPFILIVSKDQLEDVTRKLMRIGIDQAIGFITPETITTLGLPLEKQKIIDFEEMNNALNNPNAQILDVRNENEFKTAHLPNATHLFVGTLTENLHKIDTNKELYLHCQSGDRATIATSLLYRAGIKKIKNYSGSMKDWKEKNGQLIK
ncbi:MULTISPECIES: MBL fold metallo-hydrolase [Sphingobacterium]|uniref:MBL fold metallo-hydrolase n=1 Tax=Sphingobacterium TaxID=28453 RepID=UPI00038A0082|nr:MULTISPECIES: MBL fold metallo-hydrolase [Sphingobacterium]KKX48851.1 Zn-dependent hydrolase [Sphingobacterium sp. IITKGP-BTPF85]MBB2953162.1 hydroxyacylglutathione hydrolase [Sphingobacterium sp. JUb56]MCW2261606.1 hydroxyacylglutathione hydrolase [Sphingobacterium kitahiroshimense]NJI75347.1 MBL fold metallo-hydrolase [Sphingobacterium sp. B16(2022)]TCR09917.1 hydroxyacylglutathione hydrolase [Sphingobacterium sp. JUb78]